MNRLSVRGIRGMSAVFEFESRFEYTEGSLYLVFLLVASWKQ